MYKGRSSSRGSRSIELHLQAYAALARKTDSAVAIGVWGCCLILFNGTVCTCSLSSTRHDPRVWVGTCERRTCADLPRTRALRDMLRDIATLRNRALSGGFRVSASGDNSALQTRMSLKGSPMEWTHLFLVQSVTQGCLLVYTGDNPSTVLSSTA